MATYHEYTPFIPSPLSPRSQEPESKLAAMVRKRRHVRMVRRAVDVSPSERLLRYKGALAWRTHVLMQEVAEYERAMRQAIATRERQENEQPTSTSPVQSQQVTSLWYQMEAASLERDEKVSSPKAKLVHSEEEGDEERSMFQMPDLSFLAPWRVALAFGLMRRIPSSMVTNNSWLKCAETQV